MLDALVHLILIPFDVAWFAAARRSRQHLALSVVFGGLAFTAVTLGVLAFGGSGFAVLRAWCWLLFAHAPIVLLTAAASAPSPRQRTAAALAAALLLAVGVDAFFVEPRWLRVRTELVPVPGLAEPMRLVVLSDVQTDNVGAFERSVFERATGLGGDAILLPGDFVQARPSDRAAQVAAFRALLPLLRAPLGVWAVGGNAETEAFADELFGGTHVRATVDTHREDLGPFTLTALSFADGFDPDLTLAPADGPHVVFAHGPDFALSDRVSADLLVAGHTHGGQVRLPGFGPPLTLTHVPREAASGTPTVTPGGGTLIVSRGIGMERGPAPRLRFLCRPEILVIDLIPSTATR